MTQPVIKLQDVSFHYKDVTQPSLQHINLQIHKGEVVVLCGASGCGKSTLIRLMNGLIPFYYDGDIDGSVQVLGHDTQQGTIYDLGCQMSTVFQNPRSQFFCVDVKSELAFAAENLKLPKEEILSRMDKAAQELSLSPFMERTMFQLSGGEKQRIACACTAVTDSHIIVLDEPSSNLDMAAIAELKQMLLYWKQHGKTVVIAEHRLHYLQDVLDRVIYLRDGRIVEEWNQSAFRGLSSDALTQRGLRNRSYAQLTIANTIPSQGEMHLKDFRFSYKGMKTSSLDIPALTLPSGAVVAIIGRNGAGKSTFVRALCGLEKKAKGMLMDGKATYKTKQRLDRSFLVMQDVNHQLFTESVEEELNLSMKQENPQLLDILLTAFDLDDFRQKHPMALSGGQKQRVAVASAIASQRDYIVFDEPTSGLDYFHMMQVADCVKKLQKQGKTIFIITHDIELIYACCNQVLHLADGRVKDCYVLNKQNEGRLQHFFDVDVSAPMPFK